MQADFQRRENIYYDNQNDVRNVFWLIWLCLNMWYVQIHKIWKVENIIPENYLTIS